MRFCEHINCRKPVFGTDKKTRLGYCKSHQYLRTDIDKRSIIQKAMSKEKAKGIASKLKQIPANIEMVNHKLELDEFFRVAALELSFNPICQECNGFIKEKIYRLKNNVWAANDNYRNATAHILPKAKFPSVSCNPNNRLFLCTENGCHDRTHRLDTFSEMEIFPEAVRKFRLFEKEITENHKYLDLFIEYSNQL